MSSVLVFFYYRLSREYSNGKFRLSVRPSVTFIVTLGGRHRSMDFIKTWYTLRT